MKLTPEYAENIIVAIVDKKELSWYVADKEIWYMDYGKRIREFEERGYNINLNYLDEARKELLLIDTNNIDEFKRRIQEFKVETEELKEYLIKARTKNTEWCYDLSPSLYIDFDNKTLYSAYREMTEYERYAPLGWNAEYKEFLSEVPLRFCYWKDGTEVNYFE